MGVKPIQKNRNFASAAHAAKQTNAPEVRKKRNRASKEVAEEHGSEFALTFGSDDGLTNAIGAYVHTTVGPMLEGIEKNYNSTMRKLVKGHDEHIVKEIERAVLNATSNMGITQIKIPEPYNTTTQLNAKHKSFDDVLSLVANDVPVWLWGPSGTGKTHTAYDVARCLEIPFYPCSISEQTLEFKLTGYMDATGMYHDTSGIFAAYTSGGLFLLDEADTGQPSVLTALNMLMENDFYTFPNGETHRRHENFRIIAGANTEGTGATQQYVGRNRLDAATIDRMVYMHYGYDMDLERTLYGDTDWTRYCHAWRTALEEAQIAHMVTSRAIRRTNQLALLDRFEPHVIEKMCITKHLDSDQERMARTNLSMELPIS